MENQDSLELALSIISGRKKVGHLSQRDWEELGYDTYRFGWRDRPNEDDIKIKAEEIIFNCLVNGVQKEEK